MFKVGALVKLAGALTVTTRKCECCSGVDMLKLLDDESRDMFYCTACFNSLCKCGGSKIKTEEK